MTPTTISFNSPIDSIPATSPFGNDTGIEQPIAMQEPVPQEQKDISNYYFYVGEVRQVNYDVHTTSTEQQPNTDLFVDVDIMVNCPGKYVKLTKRIKLCKQMLAQEADCKDALLNTTATFVEQKEEPVNKKSSTQRMIELAGIRHPKNFV